MHNACETFYLLIILSLLKWSIQFNPVTVLFAKYVLSFFFSHEKFHFHFETKLNWIEQQNIELNSISSILRSYRKSHQFVQSFEIDVETSTTECLLSIVIYSNCSNETKTKLQLQQNGIRIKLGESLSRCVWMPRNATRNQTKTKQQLSISCCCCLQNTLMPDVNVCVYEWWRLQALKIRHQNKIKFTQIHRNAYIHCSSLCHTYIYVTHSLQPFTFYVFALHRQFGAHQPNDRHVFSKHIIIELHLNHVIRPHWHIDSLPIETSRKNQNRLPSKQCVVCWCNHFTIRILIDNEWMLHETRQSQRRMIRTKSSRFINQIWKSHILGIYLFINSNMTILFGITVAMPGLSSRWRRINANFSFGDISNPTRIDEYTFFCSDDLESNHEEEVVIWPFSHFRIYLFLFYFF